MSVRYENGEILLCLEIPIADSVTASNLCDRYIDGVSYEYDEPFEPSEEQIQAILDNVYAMLQTGSKENSRYPRSLADLIEDKFTCKLMDDVLEDDIVCKCLEHAVNKVAKDAGLTYDW